MKKNEDRHIKRYGIILMILCVSVAAWLGRQTMLPLTLVDWFLTPDQQGDLVFNKAVKTHDIIALKKAAERYRDPMRKGMALYRAGEFKDAAAAFARLNSPEALYNQGNALLMHGAYNEAIIRYNAVLVLRPAWKEAEENKALAAARAKLIETKGGNVTDGKGEPPDEIVFDQKKNDSDYKDAPTITIDSSLSDKELQAVWLRRIQTRPADFLRVKFAFQASRETQATNLQAKTEETSK